MRYYVYILSNKYCNVLYTGVTSDLLRRVYEHKNHLDKGSFTARSNVEYLIYFECTSDVKAAIEAIFNVTVTKVNTIRQFGKQKRFRGYIGQRSDYKKAVVTLAEGQNIDVTTGL